MGTRLNVVGSDAATNAFVFFDRIFVIFKTVKCYREPREALPSIVYSNLVNEAPNDGNELNSEQAQEKEKLVFEEEY